MKVTGKVIQGKVREINSGVLRGEVYGVKVERAEVGCIVSQVWRNMANKSPVERSHVMESRECLRYLEGFEAAIVWACNVRAAEIAKRGRV